MNENEALYPIREVSRLTGVNPITLRAWERRYGLFEPVRTASGHRLFTQEVVERIQRAVALTEKGIPISQVKQFLKEASNPASPAGSQGTTMTRQPAAQPIGDGELVHSLLAALEEADVAALEGLFDRLWSEWPESVSRRLLVTASLRINERDAVQCALWEAVLQPRLLTRLYHARRALGASAPRVWLNCTAQNWCAAVCSGLFALAALRLADLGVYALWGEQPETDGDTGRDARQDEKRRLAWLKALRCEGLALVSDGVDAADWQVWQQRHASLDLYYFAVSAEVGTATQDALQALNRQLGVNCEIWQPF